MKHQETTTPAEPVTEKVSALPTNEHEWNDRKWARCNLCGIYEDDYEPHELPECSDKARDDYSASVASEYEEPER
jgi:hypothetical protein